MNKIFYGLILIVILSGCAGPKFTGESIKNTEIHDVVIINDKETRSGFQQTMESWLDSSGYKYTSVPDGTNYDLDKLNLEYVGHWSWDLALYLSDARITAYYKGQKAGEIEFKSPNSLNLNKFGSASERINYMMDALFSKISIATANKLIRTPKQE